MSISARFQLLQQLQQKAVGTTLRAISAPLSLPELHSPATQLLARQLVSTMQRSQGVGLAAAQVGRNVRMFVAELDEGYEHEEEDAVAMQAEKTSRSRSESAARSAGSNSASLRPRLVSKLPGAASARPQPSVVINPRIVRSSSRLFLGVEGCLSLPGLVGRVPRADSIDVSYLDGTTGQLVSQTLHGFRARIFAHELDHLNGVLFIDKLNDPRHIWTDESFPDEKL